MKFRRIKAAAIVVLFLTAGVLYSANRSQDIFSYEEGFYAGEVEASQRSFEAAEQTAEVSGEASAEVSDTACGLTGADVSETAGQIHVHVCGAVKVSGVYLIPETSIVKDAVEAAGGMLEGAAADYLNLAGTISEGDKIYVPYLKDVEEPYGAAQNSFGQGTRSGQEEGKGQADLVNINTADSAQLMTLSGIGQTRADAIIAYRESNGKFRKIEDIMKVSGIKEGAFNKIKDQITV